MRAADRPHPAEPINKLLPWAVASFLLVAIAIVYGQTLGFDFLHYDDQLFVTECRPVRLGLTGPGIFWAFTNGPAGDWYPLAMLSHMLDVEMYGLNPAGHFLTNVLLHAATAIGLFLLLRRATGEFWPSALVATLLAVHPLHVESVAWIAERRDVLSGFLFVLTLAAYLGYVNHGRSLGRYLLVGLLLALGLMAKPMLVTVPPLLLLFDYWPLGRFGHAADLPRAAAAARRESLTWLIVEKLPLVAFALADSALTLKIHVASWIPWRERISNALVSIVTYLIHLFCPTDLAPFYPYAEGGEPTWKVAASATLLAAISAAAVVGRRRRPYCFVGWFWFLGMLVPVLGLVQISHHARADRYTYLPMIGLYIAIAWSVWRWASQSFLRRRLAGAVAAAVIVMLIGLATHQTWFWHDGERLWNHAIAVSGDTAEAETGLGETMRARGRLDEAIEHFRRSLALFDDPEVRTNYGVVLFTQGKMDDAAEQFRLGLERNPNSALLLGNMGAVLQEQGHLDEAISYYLRAVELDGTFFQANLNLARLLVRLGHYDDALIYGQRAVELEPQDEDARQLLADILKVREIRQRQKK